jgi:hypothetical protein
VLAQFSSPASYRSFMETDGDEVNLKAIAHLMIEE